VAFQPQISYEAAMINNDILAISLYSWILYLLVRALQVGISSSRAAIIGIAFGLALLTKISSATALPLIVATFWWARGRDGWQPVLAKLTTAGAVSVALVAPWLVFMYATYGDFTGLRALSALQEDAGLISHARFVDLLFSADFAVARWKETWGEFGWRLIPISPWLLSSLAVVAALAGAGLVVQALAAAHTPLNKPDTHIGTRERKALAILAAACVLGYLAVVQFGTQFVLTQARYMFPAVIGAALLGMLGLQAWIPPAWRVIAQGTIVLAAVALNIAILTAHVIPYWYFRP
jgi:4-amino-4-deoxy-L-arabinose transferase-like glycosyltransferase